MVVTSGSSDNYAAGNHGQTGLPASLDRPAKAPRATVAEVSELLDSGRDALFVSLLASADEAVLISDAAASNKLRLILMPEEPRSLDSLPTLQEPAAGADR